MSPVDVARIQFGVTTVYHFLFVPLTISLVFIVAGFQTAWFRSGDEKYLKLTKFYGELFLINFAMGVVTGIVQEFQFGMNWSQYSRFVGDIFGAPLAIEALLAFFMESVFLGVWIFGWDRLPKIVHLASIWLTALGTLLSAYFILAANAWMQHPVGFVTNTVAGRAELKDFIAVLTNSLVLLLAPHVISGAFLTGGAFVLGVAVWRIVRRPDDDVAAFRTAARVGAVVLLVGGLAVLLTGDQLGQRIAQDQPMKFAASEDIQNTQSGAPFSVITIFGLDGKPIWSLDVPYVLSILADHDPNGVVQGLNQVQAQEQALYGPGDYMPAVPVIFYSFRFMLGAGTLAAVAAAWFLWSLRKGKTPGRGAVAVAVVLPFLPLAANSFGWLLTEMGRQPWVVTGQLLTSAGVSPNVSATDMLITLVGFVLLYGVLALIEMALVIQRIKGPFTAEPSSDAEPSTSFSY
jgi:cytochrome bd ubiquinol oxidase subunit I